MRTALALACLALALVLPLGALPAHAQSGDQRFPKMDVRKLPDGTRVNVEASQFTFDATTRVGVATGEVVLTYGPYLLVGTKVTYDQDDDIMRAEGQIHMREPNGNILSGDLIELQNKFRDGFAEHLRLLLTNDATVRADYAKRSDGNVTVFTRATYTRCKTCVLSNGTPLWQVRSAEAKHVETDHRVYHRNASFEFAGVPVFYTPYFSHPDGSLENQSGFLTPNLSRSSVYGWGLSVPYLWSLDPSYDVTLMPMITSEHGIMPRAEWRQRTKNGQYSVDAAAIHEDNDNGWRSYARLKGKFNLNSRWAWGMDVTAESDDRFARDYKIDNRRVVTNQVFLTGIDDRDYFSARAMSFRNLVLDNDEQQPVAAPYVQHSVTLEQEVLGGTVGVDSSFYRVTRDEFLDRTNQPVNLFQSTGQTRASSTVHWQRREANSLGTLLTPFAMVRGDVYQTEELPNYLTPADPTDTADGDVVGRLLPTAGLDVRWPFVSASGYGDHVLTPVAQLISSSNETDRKKIGNEDAISVNFDINSLFLSDRFTGLDRFEGGTRVNTGLMYNFLAPSGGFLRASLGQSFHLAGENSYDTDSGLENDSSDVVAGFALQPWRALQLSYQIRLDDESFNVHAQEAALQARFDRVNLKGGYAELDAEQAYGRIDNEQQMWVDASATIYGPWNMFGGAHYDIERSTMIRNFVGVGFDCDCLNAKLYYTEDYDTSTRLRKDRSLLFSVDLKTLGSSKTISPF